MHYSVQCSYHQVYIISDKLDLWSSYIQQDLLVLDVWMQRKIHATDTNIYTFNLILVIV